MTEVLAVDPARTMTPRTQSRDAQDYLLTLMPALSDALTAAVISRPRDPYMFIAHQILKQSTLPSNSIIFAQLESFIDSKLSLPTTTKLADIAAIAPAPIESAPIKVESAPSADAESFDIAAEPAVESSVDVPVEAQVAAADEVVAAADEPVVEPSAATPEVDATEAPIAVEESAATEVAAVDNSEAPSDDTTAVEAEAEAEAEAEVEAAVETAAAVEAEVTESTETVAEPTSDDSNTETAETSAEAVSSSVDAPVEATTELTTDDETTPATEVAAEQTAVEAEPEEPATEEPTGSESAEESAPAAEPEVPAAEEVTAAESSSESTTEIAAAEVAAPHPLHIIIAGAACSGKGTQCELIKKKYNVVHISTGDLLREEAKAGTELGVTAKSYMERGLLLPDELIIGIVNKRLSDADCIERGWLLDGFPRSAGQAEALIAAGINADVFFVLDVPDEVLIERVVGRRMDPETGDIYHLKFSPPTDETVAARLIQRDDDTEEKIKTRLDGYHNNVASIEGLYNAIMRKLNGNQSKDVVFEQIDSQLANIRDTTTTAP